MQEKKTNWKPTNKWWGQFAVTLGTILTIVWTGDGVNTDDEKKAVIGLVVALATTYWLPNSKDRP